MSMLHQTSAVASVNRVLVAYLTTKLKVPAIVFDNEFYNCVSVFLILFCYKELPSFAVIINFSFIFINIYTCVPAYM